MPRKGAAALCAGPRVGESRVAGRAVSLNRNCNAGPRFAAIFYPPALDTGKGLCEN